MAEAIKKHTSYPGSRTWRPPDNLCVLSVKPYLGEFVAYIQFMSNILRRSCCLSLLLSHV